MYPFGKLGNNNLDRSQVLITNLFLIFIHFPYSAWVETCMGLSTYFPSQQEVGFLKFTNCRL